MKRHALIALFFIAGNAWAVNGVTVDDTARLLAGLPVKGALEAATHTTAWQEHATAMDEAWSKKEKIQLEPIRTWMRANAGEYYRSSETMYYMFSGPDFLYANTFFPRANTYILAGLEPIGNVPDLTRMSPETLARDLSALRSSMKTMLSFHYFITKDMRAELGGGNVSGTLPILYVFLARLGCTVIDATPVNSPASGVKITFTNGRDRQTLYYFKTDLSGGNTGFLRWCAAKGPGLSLLKAASYLMHGEGFSGTRNFLLEHSRVIVQDDSGIPFHAFGKNWKVECYGRYVPHKEMFGGFRQKDLASIYDRNPPPPELPFAFGYHWQKDRGILMLGTRN